MFNKKSLKEDSIEILFSKKTRNRFMHNKAKHVMICINLTPKICFLAAVCWPKNE